MIAFIDFVTVATLIIGITALIVSLQIALVKNSLAEKKR